MRTRSTGFRSQLILYDVLFAELMLFPNKVALLVNFLPLQLRTLKNRSALAPGFGGGSPGLLQWPSQSM